MDTVGVRELAERASAIVGDVTSSGHPVLVTKRGHPVAVVSAVDEEALYDYVLAHAPEFTEDMRSAEREHARGERNGEPLNDVIAELEADEDTAAGA